MQKIINKRSNKKPALLLGDESDQQVARSQIQNNHDLES